MAVEAEVITKFLTDLINATSDCIQAISDQCLAKGLIARSTYDRVLESGGTSNDKARTLILAVQNSTKTDNSCFDILLEILDEQLPPASKQKLLLKMTKEQENRANFSQALAPAHSQQQSTDHHVRLTVASQQCMQEQNSLLGRFEGSISRLSYSSAEKKRFEAELQRRTEDSDQLKDKLETLECQVEASSLATEKDISMTKSRILACETDIGKLKRKIEELGVIIEEERMQTKRGRNTIRIGTKRLIDQVVQQSQQEIKRSREDFMEILKRKEQALALAEQEAMIQRRMQEDANAKVRELDLKLKLQEKEFQLELNNVKMGQSYPPDFEDVSTQQASVSNVVDSGSKVPSIEDLLNELHHIAYQWKVIGIYLGISVDLLSKIKSDNGDDDSACLREMLETWLKRVSPPPSWTAITDTIKMLNDSRSSELAYHLRDKYCGTFTRLSERNHAFLLKKLLGFSGEWMEIASGLGFTIDEIYSIYENPLLKSSGKESMFSEMLSRWLQWAPGDARESPNYPSLEALKDVIGSSRLSYMQCDLSL